LTSLEIFLSFTNLTADSRYEEIVVPGKDASPITETTEFRNRGGMIMTRSKKVREIYSELKSIYGDDISSRELLECASLIVDASENSLYEPKISNRIGRVPFSELPVNLVMEDYSWKVLNREIVWEDDFSPQISQQELIEQCLELAA